MSFLRFFKKQKYGGYIQQLKLETYWDSCSPSEKEMIRDMWYKMYNINHVEWDTKGVKLSSPLKVNACELLTVTGEKLCAVKSYETAEKTFKAAVNWTKDPQLLNRIYESMLDMYYKMREEREDALDLCAESCQKSIALFPKLEDAEGIEGAAFKRLAIIYENQQKYTEAIQISELAMKYGLTDGTKGGYAGRTEKLKKKVSNG